MFFFLSQCLTANVSKMCMDNIVAVCNKYNHTIKNVTDLPALQVG